MSSEDDYKTARNCRFIQIDASDQISRNYEINALMNKRMNVLAMKMKREYDFPLDGCIGLLFE